MGRGYFFAVDIGATSGRTIIGGMADGRLEIRELTRFANRLIMTGGHYYWDIYALYDEIVRGLRVARKEDIDIRSIGIDTWGVDFAFVGKDGGILRNPYSYRDPHTMGMSEEFFKKKMGADRVYELTGIQMMPFNTLFQLYALRREGCSALEAADKILFMPDALSYMLTGRMVTEYTIASTSQLLNARTKAFEEELLDAVGVRQEQFGRMVMPGTVVGTLTEDVKRQTGLGDVTVVAVAGHDTASAVAAMPAKGGGAAYLSSGTWSLMGIEVADAIITEESFAMNFTNEGGIEGTTRFLKNICGMWLLEQCRKEWDGAGCEYDELMAGAREAEAFRMMVNPDAQCFANPRSMTEAIAHYCEATGQPVARTRGEVTRCILDSLAMRYRQVFGRLRAMAPTEIEVMHVIGGGSRNELLNQFVANACGVSVVAGPTEATAIGNIMLQAKACGEVEDVKMMREVIRRSVETRTYTPQDVEEWDEGYERYLECEREDI